MAPSHSSNKTGVVWLKFWNGSLYIPKQSNLHYCKSEQKYYSNIYKNGNKHYLS